MTALAARLDQLWDDVCWFARATELRLHLVLVEGGALEPALRLVMKGSRIPERPVPYLLCTEPYTGPRVGWGERLQTLESAFGTVRDELVKRSHEIVAPPAAQAEPSHAAFGGRLSLWMKATEQQTAGAVVILAPGGVEAPARFLDEVGALVEQPRLASARWVVVLPERGSLAPLVERLGEAALVSDCMVPEEEALADLRKMLANAEAAGPEAPALARAGMAWPKQAPPPRVGVVQRPPDPQDKARDSIRTSLLQAAVAMRTEKGLEAVRALRAAYDASAGAGLVDEQVAIHLVMGATAAALDRPLAIRELDKAYAEGLELKRPMAAAQAAQAKAALQAASKDLPAAIATYAEAVSAAKLAGDPAKPILIELLRAAGHLCMDAKMEDQGSRSWREAIALAEDLPPGVEAGGAVEAARALAALCGKRGLIDHAVSLEAQADRLAAPPSIPGPEAS